MHMQSYCFALQTYCFSSVLVAVVAKDGVQAD